MKIDFVDTPGPFRPGNFVYIVIAGAPSIFTVIPGFSLSIEPVNVSNT